MTYKCSLSHPKLERENENHETVFLLQIYAKNRKISFTFIKCRNFYVFLIKAICCGKCVVAFVIILMKKKQIRILKFGEHRGGGNYE